jgi:hypothetical protein
MMFDEYKLALRNFYIEQKQSNALSTELEHPNRTKLKQEFLRSYRAKHDKSDTEVIKRFFDPENKYDNQLDSIDKFDLDKLRPLINFLKKGSILQADEPIHALAWLLGFKPYNEWKNNPLTNTEPSSGEKKDHRDSDNRGHEGDNNEKRAKIRGDGFQIYIFIGFGLLVFFILFSMTWRQSLLYKINNPIFLEKCMYWEGSHYVPVKCEDISINKPTIPLNKRILNNMQKVKWPDLLTKKDLGKVWYAKIDGRPEFFTDSGSHPIDLQKKLKPLTTYMLSHHVNYYRFLFQILACFVALIVITIFLYNWLCKIIATKKPIKAEN